MTEPSEHYNEDGVAINKTDLQRFPFNQDED